MVINEVFNTKTTQNHGTVTLSISSTIPGNSCFTLAQTTRLKKAMNIGEYGGPNPTTSAKVVEKVMMAVQWERPDVGGFF